MKLNINRDTLVRPLQQVAGVVERRQTLPVLSNVLLRVGDGQLSLTGTDLEVQMVAQIPVESASEGETTVSARKLLDICRELPEGADVELAQEGSKVTIRSGRFKSALVTLPAADFPLVDISEEKTRFTVGAAGLKRIMDRTAFAMAQQDVRYFLNGLLLEVDNGCVKAVATDGHRLALSELADDKLGIKTRQQVIVPRKGILEMQRLLSDQDEQVTVVIGSNHLGLEAGTFKLITKLVDGKFPDYERVIPRDGNKVILADKSELRHALNRTAILSNEKFRGIRLSISDGQVDINANNPEQEEAEESVAIDYSGDSLEIGFNVGYLLDVLSVIQAPQVKITLNNASASALLEEPADTSSLFVVMPMKL